MADGGPPPGDFVDHLRRLGRALDGAGGWAALPPPALARARALFAVRLHEGCLRWNEWAADCCGGILGGEGVEVSAIGVVGVKGGCVATTAAFCFLHIFFCCPLATTVHWGCVLPVFFSSFFSLFFFAQY